MQIEAAVRLKSTLSDLPDLDISKYVRGAPNEIFLEMSKSGKSETVLFR